MRSRRSWSTCCAVVGETLPDRFAEGATTVIDGLALPDLDEAVKAHCNRLRLVALVHHPLAEETGLSQAAAEHLMRREAAALQCCRGIVCPSPKTAAAVEAYGIPPDRILVIPPGTAKPSSLGSDPVKISRSNPGSSERRLGRSRSARLRSKPA